MDTGRRRAARRELAVVLALAFGGIALALLVAFAPWYQSTTAGSGGAAVVEPHQPVVAPDLTGVETALLVEAR
jgi:hypothetical protein